MQAPYSGENVLHGEWRLYLPHGRKLEFKGFRRSPQLDLLNLAEDAYLDGEPKHGEGFAEVLIAYVDLGENLVALEVLLEEGAVVLFPEEVVDERE